MLYVITTLTSGMVPPLLPLVAAEWALSNLEAGLVTTVYAMGRLAASYPASRLRARRGTRAAVFLGLMGIVAGATVAGLAPTFPAFLAGRLLMGVGSSAACLAVFVELLEVAPATWRGRLVNGFEATGILSLALGGMLAAALVHYIGWRGVFVGTGLLTLLGVAVCRPIGPMAGRRRVTEPDRVASMRRTEFTRLAPVCTATLAMAITWAGLFFTLVPLLGHGRYGLSAAVLGLAFGAAYGAQLVGLIGLGFIIDRVRREPLFVGGTLLVAAGSLLVAVAARPALFLVGLIFVGGGFAVWSIPALILADRAGIPLPPAHLAAYRIAMDAGMIVGPLLLGSLADVAGDRLTVAGAGLILVVGALCLTARGAVK